MTQLKLNPLLWTLILLPPIFLFVAMQYSAIVFPFWDHCELVKFFAKMYDHKLALSDLWSPHNHTRPFTYRAVMILNGALTAWDIRSEYFYLLASMYGAFLILATPIWKTFDGRRDTRTLLFLLAISILNFSPAGHNNHWWSMMCQLTFTHLFLVAGLVIVARNPLRWKSSLWAALMFWLASYTLTNGIFGFFAAIVVAQFASERPLRPNRFSVFWLLNLVVLLPMYLPGLPEGPSNSASPTLIKLLYFTVIYVGAPVRNLIHFSFRHMVDVPKPEWAAVVGVLQITLFAWMIKRHFRWLRGRSPEALLFIGFTTVAVLSALATGRGRAAFDALGAANGGSSRYTLFGSYALYGMLFMVAGLLRDGELPRLQLSRRWLPATYTLFVLLSIRSYSKSIPIYRQVHDLNERLNGAFHSPTPRPDLEANVYPSPAFVAEMKEELKKMRIGPYRSYFPPAPKAPLAE